MSMKKDKNVLRICVFPVARLGTRFLPATKNIPKEMMPLVDRPIIHYGVSEAVASGCTKIAFITGLGKGSIREYFSPTPGLVSMLRLQGKEELAGLVDGISGLADFRYVPQLSPKGLGDAVRCARKVCSASDYFGVILPDDVMMCQKPALMQLDEARMRLGGSVLALERVPDDQVSRYGIAETEETEPGVHRIKALIEKPRVGETGSNLAIIGRYVLSTKIFTFLENLEPGSGGEFQLTDAISAMLCDEPVWGLECSGERLDCGTIPGWLRANLKLAREHSEYGGLID